MSTSSTDSYSVAFKKWKLCLIGKCVWLRLLNIRIHSGTLYVLCETADNSMYFMELMTVCVVFVEHSLYNMSIVIFNWLLYTDCDHYSFSP